MQVKVGQPILRWLHSMGYDVSGMPREAIEDLFLTEAAKWDLPPEKLEAMVLEGARTERSAPVTLPSRPAFLQVLAS